MGFLWASLLLLDIVLLLIYSVCAVMGILPGGLTAMVVAGSLLLLLSYLGQKAGI